jgi:hypothetical protein
MTKLNSYDMLFELSQLGVHAAVQLASAPEAPMHVDQTPAGP